MFNERIIDRIATDYVAKSWRSTPTDSLWNREQATRVLRLSDGVLRHGLPKPLQHQRVARISKHDRRETLFLDVAFDTFVDNDGTQILGEAKH